MSERAPVHVDVDELHTATVSEMHDDETH
jgi:hypothetical protein